MDIRQAATLFFTGVIINLGDQDLAKKAKSKMAARYFGARLPLYGQYLAANQEVADTHLFVFPRWRKSAILDLLFPVLDHPPSPVDETVRVRTDRQTHRETVS